MSEHKSVYPPSTINLNTVVSVENPCYCLFSSLSLVHFLLSYLGRSQTYLKFVEQLLQRHLLFRNTLQERLTAEHWKSLVGDILVQLIGQNDVRPLIFYDFTPLHRNAEGAGCSCLF